MVVVVVVVVRVVGLGVVVVVVVVVVVEVVDGFGGSNPFISSSNNRSSNAGGLSMLEPISVEVEDKLESLPIRISGGDL